MFHRARALILAGIISVVFLPDVSRGAGVTLTQSILTDLRYESNSNVAPVGGKPSSDYSLTIAPKIEILEASKSVTLKGFYMPKGYIYLKNRYLDTVSHSAGASVTAELSDKASVYASDLLGFSKDIRDVSLSGIQIGRSDFLDNTFGVGFTYRLTPRTSFDFNLSDSILEIHDSSGTVNNRTDSAAVSGNFAVTEITSIAASYTFSNFFFHSPIDRGEFESHSAMIGISHQFPYSLEVSLFGGAAYLPSVKNQYTAVGSAAIKKLFQKSTLTLEYSRGLINTSGISKFLSIDDRYAFSWNYRITDSIDLGPSVFYSKVTTKPNPEVDLTSYSFGINGHWRPYSWMTVGTNYNHFNQISKGIAGNSYKGDEVLVDFAFTTYEGRF